MRVMLPLEATGLSMLGTLVGHNPSVAEWVPFVGRAFLAGAMVAADRVRATSSENAENSNVGVRGVQNGAKGLYLLATVVNEIAPALFFAFNAFHCGDDSAKSKFYRSILQFFLSVQVADNFATGALSHPRASTNWANPAFATLGGQVLFYALTLVDK